MRHWSRPDPASWERPTHFFAFEEHESRTEDGVLKIEFVGSHNDRHHLQHCSLGIRLSHG